MSTVLIEIVEVSEIQPHPNADKLEIAIIGGTQAIVLKDTFQVGDHAVWFPPNMLIPEHLGVSLGVGKYLKHCTYPGDVVKTPCRVAAARLRGTPSYGFLIAVGEVLFDTDALLPVGTDVTAFFQGFKYEPPVRGLNAGCMKGFCGDAAEDHPEFHKYTDIENFYRCPKAIRDGENVVITEKLHGTNARYGLIKTDADFQIMVGSHRRNLKPETASGHVPVYWRLLDEKMIALLTDLADEKHSVVLFGEIFGLGVQDMDYGTEEATFRAFDISVNGRYLDYHDFYAACSKHGVAMVPKLGIVAFSKAALEKFTYGNTTLAEPDKVKAKFKGREGIVIKPTREQYSGITGGRLIVKSVSADYLDRKGGTDEE